VKNPSLASGRLMKDDREMFQKMLSDLNFEALETMALGKEPFELACMMLIFKHQKMIRLASKAS
jgi:hypothetical protein